MGSGRAPGDDELVNAEPSVTVVDPLDRPAELLACGRCGARVLLAPAGRCADCISDIGRNHPDEYTSWRRDVEQLVTDGSPGAR